MEQRDTPATPESIQKLNKTKEAFERQIEELNELKRATNLQVYQNQILVKTIEGVRTYNQQQRQGCILGLINLILRK